MLKVKELKDDAIKQTELQFRTSVRLIEIIYSVLVESKQATKRLALELDLID